VDVWNPAQISSVTGASMTKSGKLQIQMPPSPTESYVEQEVVIRFGHL